MQGLKPCPYCGGEVEMVKLNKKKKSDPDFFRIDCRSCHKLVVRGIGFPCETPAEAEELIKQYKKYMKNIYATHASRIVQSASAIKRDNSSKYGHEEWGDGYL